MRQLTVGNKLLFVLGVILFLSFAGISYLNYVVTSESVHAEIVRNDLPLTMDNIYSEILSQMTRPLLVSSSMASDTFLKDWSVLGEQDQEKIIRYLAQINEKYNFFTTFFVSAKTLNYYRYTGLHKKISPQNEHDSWFYSFIASGKEYEFDVDADEGANNSLTIFLNHRVMTEAGKLIGVVGVGLKVETVANLVGKYRQKYGRTVYLTDSKGLIQLHPDTTLIEQVRIHELEGISAIAESIITTQDGTGNFAFDRGDNHILLTVRLIEAFDWMLYVEQNETESLAVARKNVVRTIAIGIFASIIIIVITLMTINRYQKKIESSARKDELTGIANRRALEENFALFRYNALRTGTEFCALMLDLDHFKKVNDQLGHLAGDQLLVEIVALVSQQIRPTDIFSRWGGDEFVILTNNAIEDALLVADRIQHAINRADFSAYEAGDEQPPNSISLSCGLSVFSKDDSLDSLLLRADQAMYICKARGGDCIQVS